MLRTTRAMFIGGTCAIAALFAALSVRAADGTPRIAILMIGDGMGFEHLRAASLYATGSEAGLFMQTLSNRAQTVTAAFTEASTNGQPVTLKVTDSAAAATAMATGRKVYNSVLSVALPGNGEPLQTVLEAFAAAGKRTGIVTSSYLTDATPAAFGAHVRARNLHALIATNFLLQSRPTVLLGGGTRDPAVPLSVAAGQAAGYAVVTNRAGLAALAADPATARVLGLFGAGQLPYEHDYAAGAPRVAGTLDNTDLARLLLGTFTEPTRYTPALTPDAATAHPAIPDQD